MSKQQVKIISGWSDPGGSTAHHISLTNLLNENGYECTFYGPHDYHLDKCQSGKLQDVVLTADDVLISHFINFQCPPLKRHILSCHEKKLTPLKKMDLSKYDVIQFVSNQQKKWHKVNHPSVIIPPIVQRFEWDKPNTKTAGIIGSVDANKQTHKAIAAALKKGLHVNIYGKVAHGESYADKVYEKYKDDERVTFKGQCDDKAKMYNEIDEVFHFSESETFGLVEAECRLNGIPYSGNRHYPEPETEEEILRRWKKLIAA